MGIARRVEDLQGLIQKVRYEQRWVSQPALNPLEAQTMVVDISDSQEAGGGEVERFAVANHFSIGGMP